MSEMKVFQVYPTCRYSGGIMLIAAENREQAEKMFDTSIHSDRSIFSKAYQIRGMSYKGRPRIILDSIYIE